MKIQALNRPFNKMKNLSKKNILRKTNTIDKNNPQLSNVSRLRRIKFYAATSRRFGVDYECK